MTLMRSWVGNRTNFPIPHEFLDMFIFGLVDFKYDAIEWVILLASLELVP